ncbi:PREDICTED: uncharacterized protein LOC18601830 isoform X2 [Theobroma cacao]|uniref:Uncharacterized protein LOC18601830 isoform X2 n=1 Tax=Theobroma cacao TaxID=3641 RepID=A0AB32W9E9_THECC|nr:PREDICTED: uncharacterized protein LOC18601830 isoform X2 [Theobroma cacao]
MRNLNKALSRKIYGYFKASKIKEDLDFKSKKAHQRLMIFTECNRSIYAIWSRRQLFHRFPCYMTEKLLTTYNGAYMIITMKIGTKMIPMEKGKKKGHIQVAFSFLDRHFSACLRWCIWNLQPEKKNGASQKAPRAFE